MRKRIPGRVFRTGMYSSAVHRRPPKVGNKWGAHIRNTCAQPALSSARTITTTRTSTINAKCIGRYMLFIIDRCTHNELFRYSHTNNSCHLRCTVESSPWPPPVPSSIINKNTLFSLQQSRGLLEDSQLEGEETIVEVAPKW
jgi:hypothetical protein